MKYNFDLETERRATGSLKWDVLPSELPMWVADMDFETAPAVKRAIVEIAERGIYGYSITDDGLFESASDFFYERTGYRHAPSDMIYSSGVVAAISSMVRKLTTPAEKVLIMAPVYNIFYNSILNNGRVAVSSDLLYEDGKYAIDFYDLEKKLSDPQTTLMILCNPHNPVGRIWTKEELSEVGRLCKSHGVTVISDEIHSSVLTPGKKYVPFASASEVCADISLTCISASKAFNLAGLQSAIVVAKNPILRHKAWRGINTDEVGEPNAFAVAASTAAYREGGEWLDALNKYIYENKLYCYDFIEKNIPAIRALQSDATYLLWVDVSSLGIDSPRFCAELREATGLYVSDGEEYGECARYFIRINLATQRSRVADGMNRLRKYVDLIIGGSEKCRP